MIFIATLVSGLNRGLAILAGVATFLVMLLIVADVTLRFMGGGVPGTLEIVTYYLMLIVAFLAVGRVEQSNGMITVDALYDVFAARRRRWIMVISTLISAVVYGGLAYTGMQEALNKYATGAYAMTLTYKLVIWPAYFVVPLAFATATATAALRCIAALMGQRVPPSLITELGLDSIWVRGKVEEHVPEGAGQ